MNEDYASLLKESGEYEQAVDKYSKHEFMIINGQTATEGPEFASYIRIYESIYFKIKEQILNL